MSGAQLHAIVGDDLAGILGKLDDRKLRQEQLALQMEDRKLARQDRADLQRENTVIQEKILDASSYTNISEKVNELGFAPNATQVVLDSALPIAYKQ
mgnify:CR=1 FL=1